MELVLIRHTKVAVEKGICYGFTDVDVASTFKEEVLDTANQIKSLSFDEIWSSPLSRSLKLAKELFPHQTINTDERLKELNFGDWEGLTWEQLFELSEGKSWMENYLKNRCPNGESFQDQINRIIDFYKEKKKSFNYKRIAIISHGGSIRAFLCHLQNMNPEKAFDIDIDYGSVTTLNITND